MFQRILVGLDGSPLGRQAFQAALELAELYRARLVALSVVEGAMPGHRETEEAESFDYYRRLQANATEQANAAGLTLDTVTHRGHAARALVECAQEVDADLIMIGATGHEHPWHTCLKREWVAVKCPSCWAIPILEYIESRQDIPVFIPLHDLF